MINKVNLFFNPNKNKKRFKLQLKALNLGIVLMLSSCNFNLKNPKNELSVSYNNISTTSNDNSTIRSDDNIFLELNIPSNSKIELSELTTDIINCKFELTSEENNYFNNFISAIEVDYPMSEYFQIDNFLQSYDSLNEYNSNQSNLIIKDNYIDADDLYNQVIKNNESFLIENHGVAKKYEDTTNYMVKNVCNVIASYLNNFIEENSNININELDIKLSELKIFESSTFSYAYFNPNTGILGISTSTIESVKQKSQDELTFEKIIEHETNHIIQACTIEELSNNKQYSIRFGPCYKFNDLQVNCGYWNWYYESTAESLTSKYNNTNSSLTYQYDIGSLETIKTATVLKPDTKIYDLEELSQQSDLNQVFNYFNCRTKEDKAEIIEMMYAFNIINEDNYSSSTNDFYQLYKEINNENMDFTSRRFLKLELSASIGLTLSKQFYSNLSNIITEKEITIEELFQIISVYETEMSKLTKYYSNYNDNYTREFIEKYSAIQYTFFELIANELNITPDDIKNAYIEYNANFEIKKLKISYLVEDKAQFYEYIIEKNKSFKDASITLYNDYLDKQNSTKR